MNKVILVVDDPMFCCNCPLARERKFRGGYVCGIGHDGEHGEWVYEAVDMDSETKPDWCPLKPVPEKISDFDDIVKAKSENAYEVGMCMYNKGLNRGYNTCIERILK